MISRGRTIITGLGRGMGIWVTTAALEALYQKSEFAIRSDRVIARPFPAGSDADASLRTQHRQRMLSEASFAVFMAGSGQGRSGTKEEYAIARGVGTYVLPVGATGNCSKELWSQTYSDLDAICGSRRGAIEALFQQLNDASVPLVKHVDSVDEIINRLSD